MIDPLYDLAKEINCPADAYEENSDADAERLRSKVRGVVRLGMETAPFNGVPEYRLTPYVDNG